MRSIHVLTTLFVFIAIVSTYALLAIRYPMGYIWATYEDLIGEWAQFWMFVISFALSIRILFIRTRYRRTFALLAVACLYVAMEEISWGQRILGFESPDLFKEHNLQSETNIHNFLTGPFGTNLKTTIAYALAAALVGFGVVYPLAVRLKWSIAVWLDDKGLASPPLSLSPFFLFAAILEVGPFSFNEAEVAEVLVGMAVTLFALHYSFALKQNLSPLDTNQWNSSARFSLANSTIILAVLIVSVGASTTFAVYMTKDGRRRIENRIENGVEKFAGRYGRYERWDISVRLYETLRESKPGSRSTLRKLANALAKSGDDAGAEKSLRKALNIDQKKLKKDPRAASVHRSIIRTYRMLGDDAKADEHLEQVLEIGLDRIEQHPDSANAAYSLGRTYELMDVRDKALVQFERAYRLKPTSKDFKKAYLRTKHR